MSGEGDTRDPLTDTVAGEHIPLKEKCPLTDLEHTLAVAAEAAHNRLLMASEYEHTVGEKSGSSLAQSAEQYILLVVRKAVLPPDCTETATWR